MADSANIVNPAKLIKLDDHAVPAPLDVAHPFESFKSFKVKRILKENPEHRVVVVEGLFNGDSAEGHTSVVILEKSHFTEEEVHGILSENTAVECLFNNDVYYNLLCYPPSKLNGIKATVVHPATEKHIEKYSTRASFLIEETPLVYQNVTLPHIRETKFDLQVS